MPVCVTVRKHPWVHKVAPWDDNSITDCVLLVWFDFPTSHSLGSEQWTCAHRWARKAQRKDKDQRFQSLSAQLLGTTYLNSALLLIVS